MTDDEQRAVEVAQRLLQDLDGSDVEMVGGLVQQQQPGRLLATERAGEACAQPLAAGQRRYRLLGVAVAEREAAYAASAPSAGCRRRKLPMMLSLPSSRATC
jgi:hypothetical protein